MREDLKRLGTYDLLERILSCNSRRCCALRRSKPRPPPRRIAALAERLPKQTYLVAAYHPVIRTKDRWCTSHRTDIASTPQRAAMPAWPGRTPGRLARKGRKAAAYRRTIHNATKTRAACSYISIVGQTANESSSMQPRLLRITPPTPNPSAP